MNHQKPQIKPTRKEFLRREMLACAHEARAARKWGEWFALPGWNEAAAKRLFQLGGMAARW